ncbi:unnamed protein product [Auanema sp. JU1783]|nr:unnamed protein product [Auanema sp. JU1783]
MARSHIPNIILEEEDEDEDNDLPNKEIVIEPESVDSHKINKSLLSENTYRHYTTPNRTFAPYERRDSGAVFSKPLLTAIPPLEERSDSIVSEESQHDFAIARIEDITLNQMLEISTLSEKQSRFGTSKKYLNSFSMMEYVTVQLQLSSNEEVEEIKKELELLTHLRHNNLARFYGYHISSNFTVTMFRAFMPSGTIADKIKQGPLSEEQALRFYRQALQGLKYLHAENVIHGNLKCANLLVTLSNQVQLADLSVILVPEPDAHLRRSLLHSAPELLEDRKSLHKTTDATDIWASGCVLVAMLTRFLPFQDQFILIHSATELHEKLVVANQLGTPQLSYTAETLVPNCSEQLSSILNSVFTRTSSLRPTAAELIEKFFEPSTRQVSESFSAPRPTYLKHNDLYDEPEVDTPDFYSPEDLLSRGLDSGPKLEEVSCCCQWLSFVLSRIWYFFRFTFRSIGMFILSALSLALVAGTVILTIIIFYKGIGLICGCNLNEGFIVLIALILLPVLILLITLCCNNTMEKFKHSKSESRFVYTRPEHDVILCGVIVIDGKGQRKPSVRRKLATTSEEPGCVDNLPKTAFSRGVARIA